MVKTSKTGFHVSKLEAQPIILLFVFYHFLFPFLVVAVLSELAVSLSLYYVRQLLCMS